MLEYDCGNGTFQHKPLSAESSLYWGRHPAHFYRLRNNDTGFELERSINAWVEFSEVTK